MVMLFRLLWHGMVYVLVVGSRAGREIPEAGGGFDPAGEVSARSGL
jgi:hypothetical protein